MSAENPAAALDWPAVSVVIPTRGRPELLQAAVDSVLGQDYPGPVECVVVFDRTDPTIEAAEPRPGRRLLVRRNARTAGAAGARNDGILAATAELLALCDDDDEWLPAKLRLQVALLRGHPEAALVTSGLTVVHDGVERVRRPPSLVTTHADLLRDRRTALHTSTYLFVRERLLGDIGLIDENVPGSYGEDYDWLLRATRCGVVITTPEPLVRVLWHQGSWFSGRWETIIDAIQYLVAQHPDFASSPRGLGRLYGRLAFAHAALGHRSDARTWAMRAWRLNRRERRAYLAWIVSSGLIPAGAALRVATATGRGI